MLKIMRVHDKDYRIIKLLGKGKSGYSYLASDNRGIKVILKQIHHEKCDYYTFTNKFESELNAYEKLRELNICVPKLIDSDANNERIIKEFIPGFTVYDMVRYNIFDDTYMHQIKIMCDIVYRAKLNLDWYSTNFIPYNGKLYYIDYELNEYTDEWNFENWGIKYWSQTQQFMETLQSNT